MSQNICTKPLCKYLRPSSLQTLRQDGLRRLCQRFGGKMDTEKLRLLLLVLENQSITENF